MAKFRFATDGFLTVMELDGKTLGPGVEKVDFFHQAGENATLKLNIDLRDFKYCADGEYDKLEDFLMGKVESSDRQESGDKLSDSFDDPGKG